jgi:hypothetical protein
MRTPYAVALVVIAVLLMLVLPNGPVFGQDRPPSLWVPPRIQVVTGTTVIAVWPNQPPIIDPAAWVAVIVNGKPVIVPLRFEGHSGSAGIWTGQLPCASGEINIVDGVVSGEPVAELPYQAEVTCYQMFVPLVTAD